MANNQISQSDYKALLQDVLVHDSQARLQALRELKNLLARQHNIDHLPDLIRVHLAKSILSFPVTAKLASQVLLQVISNSSPIVLTQQAPAIVPPILSVFTSSTQHLRSIPGRHQLVQIIYIIRILTTLIAKAGSCALINLSDLIECIQRCYQPIQSPLQAPHPPGRIVLGLNAPRKLTTQATRTFGQSSDSETNSEGEATSDSNTNVQAVQCRLDALNFLRTIAQSDPKALYPYWSQLLPAHEYRIHQPYTLLNVMERDCQLMVRVRACNVIRLMLLGAGPYMLIAEEKFSRPSNLRVSYISLSAKIASITVELHRRLGNLLKAPPIAPELTNEILQVCETLSTVSAYHRISTPIVGYLLHPMARLLTCNDIEINIQSRKTLIVILQHLSSMVMLSMPLDVKRTVDQITAIGCERLILESTGTSALLWCDLMRTTLPFLDWNHVLLEKFLQLQRVFEEIPENEEELKTKLTLIGSLTIFFPGEEFDATYLKWVRARLREAGLDSLDMVINGKCQRNMTYLCNLISSNLQDALDDIRAIRLLGIIVSRRSTNDPLEVATQVACHLLKFFENTLEDDLDGKAVSTHAWTLANCLDAINEVTHRQGLSPPLDLSFWTNTLGIAQRLLSSEGPSNTLITNSVRIMGIAASKLLMEQQQLDSSELGDTVEQVTRKLMECLGATFPKVQWNTANALREILGALVENPVQGGSLLAALKDQICERLCDTLLDSCSFKVRIQVCLALQVARHDLPDHSLDSIAKTTEKLRDEFTRNIVPNKELEHAERLLVEIGKLGQENPAVM